MIAPVPSHPSRITRVLVLCHAVLLAARLASAEGLTSLLDAVAANAAFGTPARADVRIECGAGCAGAGGQAIFLGRGDALYVETKGGARALIRPGGILVPGGAARPGQPLADTDLLLEDLAVFTRRALTSPQVSDDGPAGVVVTAAPGAGSAYALLVHTIDRERGTIVRTLYYRDLVNNLSKTRRDGAFARVAGGWRPGEITVESVRQATRTRLTLSWREAPEAPTALFEPAGLAQPSGLAFP
jgi:hypothetical protein